MDKHQKRPRDINQRASSTVTIATGQATLGQVTQDTLEVEQFPEPSPEERHTAAVMLGRKGGLARAKKLTLERRSEIAKRASKARWNKK